MGRAQADPAPARQDPPTFNQSLAANVFSVALAFMGPRTLEPYPASQITLWGLRGLTALDAGITLERHDAMLELSQQGSVRYEVQLPQTEDPAVWATVAAALCDAARTISPAIQNAGTEGVIQSFFDEVFNHFDPYSRYIPPSEALEDEERRNGHAGIGVTVARRGAGMIIQTVVADSPAALAGMRPGDALLMVDRHSVSGRSEREVTGWISGTENSQVQARWRGRDGYIHIQDFTRIMVPPDTVFARRAGDILVLRITAFNQGTDAQFSRALQQGIAVMHRPAGIILDLRGNRGGVLRQAVVAADALLPDGVVAYTTGRDPGANRVWRSSSGELAEGVPVVVLVDGGTASAAEVFAAALADRGRAVVVGSATLGKGLVQTIAPLPDGGELFVSWSQILAPRLWPLQGLGVLPQVCTSLGEDELHRQLADLADGAQPMQAEIAAHRAGRSPIAPSLVLSLRSACPAAEGGDSDIEAARVLIENPAAYAAALLPPIVESRKTSSTIPGYTTHPSE
jgi:carboxyl-terminal processing protease